MPNLQFRLSTLYLIVALCASLLLAWQNHRKAERVSGELRETQERLAQVERTLKLSALVLKRLDEISIHSDFHELETISGEEADVTDK